MKNIITILFLILFLPVYGYSQTKNPSLIDSVLNNQLNISIFKERLDEGIDFNKLVVKDHLSTSNVVECNNDSEFIVRIGDSLFVYNYDLDTTVFITKIIHGIAASFGYIGGGERKIVTAANWDSVYYFIDTSWVYSGFSVDSNWALIHTACGNKSTYFMGSHLWHFDGKSNPNLIRKNIKYSVADLAVDERENAWVLTGTNWPISDTLRIIDSTGTSICNIPFDEPFNTFNGYGMLIMNGKVVVGFGASNPIYPSALVPLEINYSGNSVSFGDPIFYNRQFASDLAGCSKNILMPNCNITNLDEWVSDKETINVWPNPFNSRVFVTSYNQKINSIEIIDVYGRNYPVDFDNTLSYAELDLSNYPKGVYILCITLNENNIKIKKVIKR